MSEWDANSLSESYERIADEAWRYCEEVKGKLSRTSSYEGVYDEHMAKYYVYNYLHGKTFLHSKEALVKELSTMLSHTQKPMKCFDPSVFEKNRIYYIKYEIARFTSDG